MGASPHGYFVRGFGHKGKRCIAAMAEYEYEKKFCNVFADLKLPNAGALHRKALLVDAIRRDTQVRGWTQQQTAGVLGISQPKLSLMLRGRFNGISETKIMDCVAKMGNEVRIVVSPYPNPSTQMGQVQVVFA